MKRRALALSLSLLVLAALPGATLASTFTVDQSQTSIVQTIGGNSPIFAQTFTAGLYGPLESVDIYMYGHPTTAAVSLQGVTGNPAIPDGTILGSRTLGVNDVSPGWVRFAFASNPVVIPGHKYALFIYLTGALNVMYGSVGDSYHGGEAMIFQASAWHPLAAYYANTPADFAFRTNVGLAAPTPTPTPAPTRAPVATHTPAPIATPTATVAAAVTAAPTATPEITATPQPTPADIAAGVSAAATDTSAVAAAPASSGSQASGAGDSPVAIIVGGLLLLALLAGGVFFLIRRRAGQAAGSAAQE